MESAESEEKRLVMGHYLGGVRTLHVRLSAVVNPPLKHLLYASHQEDIWVWACY